MTFIIKQGDTAPRLQAKLLLPTRQAAPIAESSVRFHMRPSGRNTVAVDAAAVIVDAGTATVQYNWDAVDTSSTGSYEGEFEVTYPDGTIETFPNDGYIEILIPQQIA